MPYKVAVLMGGSSFERDFSLKSGRHVLHTLESQGHTALGLDTGASLVETLRREQPGVAYIALHGGHGEDGTIQSVLEFLDIPFVGSTSSVCKMAFDKSLLPAVVKTYRRASGEAKAAHWPRGICLSADAFKNLGAAAALDLVAERLPSGYPYAVLPASGGSALGISKVDRQDQLVPALLEALSFGDQAIIEEWVTGVELAVCVIGEGASASVLPPIEVSSHTGFFNTEARLDTGLVDYYVPVRPASLTADGDQERAAEVLAAVEAAALEVHRAFGCRDLSRVDLIWDTAAQMPRVLEINVSPGMTEVSLFPTAAAATDIGFAALLDRLLATAVERQA